MFTVVEPTGQLAWRTGGIWGRVDSTEWRITLEPAEGGTRIVQEYDVLHVAPGLDRVYSLFVKAHRDRRDALAQDLQRLAALAEIETAPSVRPAGAEPGPDPDAATSPLRVIGVAE